MGSILSVVKETSLTYQQKLVTLAKLAEDSLDVLSLPDRVVELMRSGAVCDMGEGHAPYRPRYVLPDYARFLKQGSDFLGIAPPDDMRDAVDALLALYHHVPSITSFPVWIGGVDELLEPYHESDAETRRCLKTLITHVDRTLNDSFCHMNLGPRGGRVTDIALELTAAAYGGVTNLSFKYDPDATPDATFELAVRAAMETAKPAFANHRTYVGELGERYGIASCYNGLAVGGGSFTLARLNLRALAETASDFDDLYERALPEAVDATLALIDERVRFLVEESGFFESSFLVREGLISKDRFTAMFGIVGLAEAVNQSMRLTDPASRFGHSEAADEAGERIIARIAERVRSHRAPLVEHPDGRYALHAQVGLSDDERTTPGCRIPIGEEPELHDHLRRAARFHRYFQSGIGDIFSIEPTAKRNPSYLCDLVKGAFAVGMRYLSFYASDSDVIRISGYLVKRSEAERLRAGEAVPQDTSALGLAAFDSLKVLERKIRA
jgi:YjjI family glycine radical enzyme